MRSKTALFKTAAALEEGGVAVIPTDTVYGLAARLDRPVAIDAIFRLKNRPRSKALPILVPDVKTARLLGEFDKQALEMAMESWPGAVTIVVHSTDDLPDIGGTGATVGLRIPDHPFTLNLLQETGPLVATSANPSGNPTAAVLQEVLLDLGNGPAVYVDGGTLSSPPSRVVSMIGEPRILR